MSKDTQAFYKTKAWQRVRDYAYKRDKGLCQDCLKRGIIQSAEEVHHIQWITKENMHDVNITLNEANLVSLCKKCHADRHKKKKRFSVGDNGKIFCR